MSAIGERWTVAAGILAAAVLLMCGCNDKGSTMSADKTNKDGRIQVGDYYIAPESESAARAAALLPTKGSEDASSILGPITSHSLQQTPAITEEKDYLPSPASEWVIHVTLESPNELPVASVEKVFGKEWRAKGGRNATIYGKDARTGRWTFLISADGPKSITGLQFSWPYFARWTGETNITKAGIYAVRFKEVVGGMEKLGRAELRTDIDPAAAQLRSERLSAVSEQFDRQVTLVLKAPAGRTFSGRDVWDVMLCLGLEWGDMDCFHWRNHSDLGGDFFFSVSTSTPPGYFPPEEIAANRVAVRDLVFGYSLPRSSDPAKVYERMFAAAEYARKRLGGTVVTDADRQPDLNATLNQIRATVKELETLGFSPGSEQAMRFF